MKTRSFLAVAAATLLGPMVVNAAVRVSAGYSVTTETADAGGRRTSSANYTHDGSVGGIGGISIVAVPPETTKHGYIGQLYEVTNLAVAASPTTVTEGTTRQLAASAQLDDGTALTLPGGSVAWSIVSGPISAINASGLATAGTVYQNTAATVGGSYLGKSGTLGLLVLDVNNDNFGSYAGDGLPDDWQVQYFGLGNPSANPGVDPDFDGQTNGFEFVTGTIPTDANSLFRLRIEKVAGQPTRKNLIFSPRFPSRTYTPQYRTSLTAGSFLALSGTTTTDNGSERTVTDLNATDDFRFYRVGVSYP